MEITPAIRRAKGRAEQELLSRQGVSGVDIGYKEVGGEPTDQLAIRVLVRHKRDVPEDEAIPSHIDGYPTDVIERNFELHSLQAKAGKVDLHADTGYYDPLQGGISIGPCRDINGTATGGTLGAFVTPRGGGRELILSNFHVLAVDNDHHVGDPVCNPCRPDGGTCPSNVIGLLSNQALGGSVDCAIAEHTARGWKAAIADIGPVRGTNTTAIGQNVRKRGRTTLLTYGKVDTVDLSMSIEYPGIGLITLTNQIGIKPTLMSPKFSDHGDSGAVVVNDQGEVIGLNYAGDESGYAVANPINAVLDALNVDMAVSPPENEPPVAKLSVSPSIGQVPPPLHVEFDASESYDPDGSIAEYRFNFGEGPEVKGANPRAFHTYESAGTRQVNVTVTDNERATASATSKVTVAVALFAPQRKVSDTGTSWRPSLAVFNGRLYMAWKGSMDDNAIWWSNSDGVNWATQQKVPNVGTSAGVSLAVFNGRLYMAWKGAHSDNGIWWSNFDGANWAAQQKVPDVGTSVGPSLAVFNGRLYMAWKGSMDDNAIWWSNSDGVNWAIQQKVPGYAVTSVGPSLAVFNGRLYMAWRDVEWPAHEHRIFWSSFDGANWATQQVVPDVGSSVGSSLAVFDGHLYMAWKGAQSDNEIWWSYFDGAKWFAQQVVPGVGSSVGPSLTVFNDHLYMAWKGSREDNGIWWTSSLYGESSPVIAGNQSIASMAFPGVYLRMDGSGLTHPDNAGGGNVNCQYGVGPWEKFRLEQQGDGTVAMASMAFPGVYLRMDGSGLTHPDNAGGGNVNCQYGVGPWEKFRLEQQGDGTVAMASMAFPGVYLRMDGSGLTHPDNAGGGNVNCQYGVGPWEKFRLTAEP